MVSRGWMNVTNHETVLQVLTQWAQQFHNRIGRQCPEDPIHDWRIDEMGTLETLGLGLSKREVEQLENNDVNKITIADEVLQVHGFAPPKKAEGIV